MNPRLAHLLTRLYPRPWRERYGEEFKTLLEDHPEGLRASTNVIGSAHREHIFPTQGGIMDPNSFGTLMKRPSAFLPLAMSLIALVMVHGYIAKYGGGPVADEGAIGHLWQLLMAGQLPIMAFFAVKWLRRTPKPTLLVLTVQTGAVLASCAPVLFFNLG